jgi:hypothetical protein
MTTIRNTNRQSAEQWLAEQFEYELCEECGKDADQHTVIPISWGSYGGPYFFARCNSPWTA